MNTVKRRQTKFEFKGHNYAAFGRQLADNEPWEVVSIYTEVRAPRGYRYNYRPATMRLIYGGLTGGKSELSRKLLEVAQTRIEEGQE